VTAEAHLRQHFFDLRLPPAAAEWLLGVWNAIQVLDDAADGDPIDRGDLHRAIYDLFVDLPSNPFFVHNAGILLPALSLMVLKWKASDDAERAGQAMHGLSSGGRATTTWCWRRSPQRTAGTRRWRLLAGSCRCMVKH
jgi:hypothetical protein